MSNFLQPPEVVESLQSDVLSQFPTIKDKYLPFEYDLSYDKEMERRNIINSMNSHDWLLSKAKQEGVLIEEVKYQLLLRLLGRSKKSTN